MVTLVLMIIQKLLDPIFMIPVLIASFSTIISRYKGKLSYSNAFAIVLFVGFFATGIGEIILQKAHYLRAIDEAVWNFAISMPLCFILALLIIPTEYKVRKVMEKKAKRIQAWKNRKRS